MTNKEHATLAEHKNDVSIKSRNDGATELEAPPAALANATILSNLSIPAGPSPGNSTVDMIDHKKRIHGKPSPALAPIP